MHHHNVLGNTLKPMQCCHLVVGDETIVPWNSPVKYKIQDGAEKGLMTHQREHEGCQSPIDAMQDLQERENPVRHKSRVRESQQREATHVVGANGRIHDDAGKTKEEQNHETRKQQTVTEGEINLKGKKIHES